MDMNATNGTFVNGTKLSPGQEVRLSAGDRFKLADEEFQVQ
jgi:pSer/pThr/pTyr-binding forkhead associated (FHA) protein